MKVTVPDRIAWNDLAGPVSAQGHTIYDTLSDEKRVI